MFVDGFVCLVGITWLVVVDFNNSLFSNSSRSNSRLLV